MKKNDSKLKYLINPFEYVAGNRAFIYAIFLMLLFSVLGYLSNTHFDGALDAHYGCFSQSSSYITHLWYQIINWVSLTFIMYLAARIISKSSIRFIDFAGTISLAKLPLLIVLLFGFVPSFHPICSNNTLDYNDLINSVMSNLPLILLQSIIIIGFLIWMIILMYNAFSTSANLKGTKGGVIFTIALLVAEGLSKLLLFYTIPCINFYFNI